MTAWDPGDCLTGGYGWVGTTYTFMDGLRVSDPQPGDVCTNRDHCGIYDWKRYDDPAYAPAGRNVGDRDRYRQEWLVARRQGVQSQSVSYDKMYKIK